MVQGNIPSSVNLPLSSLQKTLRLSNDDFLRQNGFPKPAGEQPMVFYCRTGKRSATAINVAKQEGFRKCAHLQNLLVLPDLCTTVQLEELRGLLGPSCLCRLVAPPVR